MIRANTSISGKANCIAMSCVLMALGVASLVGPIDAQTSADSASIQPQYGTEDIIIDAPWRVQKDNGNYSIPIVVAAMGEAGSKWQRIQVYHLVDGNATEIYSRELGSVEILSDYEKQLDFVRCDNIVNKACSEVFIEGAVCRLKIAATLGRGFFKKDRVVKVVEIMIAADELPKFESEASNWYYGDGHYHTTFTRGNPKESGGDFDMIVASADRIGLDWVTTTDHTNHGTFTGYLWSGNWAELRESCQVHTSTSASGFKLISGEEVYTYSPLAQIGVGHMVVYGNSTWVESAANGALWPDLLGTVWSSGGIAFAAHPNEGGWWGDHLSEAQGYSAFRGLEAFNTFKRHKEDVQSIDSIDPIPWANTITDWKVHLQEGVDHWDDLLRAGLGAEWPDSLFISGGSDAHGDFNYSVGELFATADRNLDDNAFGKVRTLVYCPGFRGMGDEGTEVVKSLGEGRSIATNGPIASMEIDLDGNGSADASLGDQVKYVRGVRGSIHIEWANTSEFGGQVKLKLYRGDKDGLHPIDLGTNSEPTSLTGDSYVALDRVDVLPRNGGWCYFRLEVSSKADTDFRGYSNPVWIKSELSPAQWTILAYVNGDNNLEEFALDDINEMEQIGSSSDVNIVVQIDRNSGESTEDGDWSDTRRFLVTHDTDPDHINSTRLDTDPNLGELDMGDPQTLTNFVEWGIENYPAEYYAVIVWDHGSGWYRPMPNDPTVLKSISDDYESGNAIEVANGEWASVMEAIKAKLGRKLDLVGMDACLMQMWEVADINANYADFQVGSEETEGGQGWAYNEFLDDIIATPTIAPLDFGEAIVNSAVDNAGLATQSVLQLSSISDLTLAVNRFAQSLLWADDHGYRQTIFDLRTQCLEFYLPAHIDLYQFADKVAATTSLPVSLRNEATAVKTGVAIAVILAKHSTGFEEAHGLACYYPTNNYDVDYDDLPIAGKTRWDEFVSGAGLGADASVDLGITWLRSVQNGDGSWTGFQSDRVGATAEALQVFLVAGYSPETDATVEKGVTYLLSQVRPCGGIYNWEAESGYQTGMAVTALRSALKYNPSNASQISAAVTAAQTMFKNRQHPSGGWRYNPCYSLDRDLSVTQWVVLGMEGYEDAALWSRFRGFLHSVRASNGGYGYASPSPSPTMTAAGIWGEIVSNCPDKQQHVDAAFDNWFKGNYGSLTGILNCQDNGSFWYYYIYGFAKACELAGRDQVAGEYWYDKLVTKLTGLQNSQGYWSNSSSGYETPALATSWALMSLQTGVITKGSRLRIRFTPTMVATSAPSSGMDNPVMKIYSGSYSAGPDSNGTWISTFPNSTWLSTDGVQELEILLKNPLTLDVEMENPTGNSWNYMLDFQAFLPTNEGAADSLSYSGTLGPNELWGVTVRVDAVGGLTIHPIEPPRPYPCMEVASTEDLSFAPIVNDSVYSFSISVGEVCGNQGLTKVDILASDLEDGKGHVIPKSAFSFTPASITSIPAGTSVTVGGTLKIPSSSTLDLGLCGNFHGSVIVQSFHQSRSLPVAGYVVGKGLAKIGVVDESCGKGLHGVRIDVFDGGNNLVLSGSTDLSGQFVTDSLSAGPYKVAIVPPLGYECPVYEVITTIIPYHGVPATFSLTPLGITPTAQTVAYWKHVCALWFTPDATTDALPYRLGTLSDQIYNHFQKNPVIPVPLFEEPYNRLDIEKIAKLYRLLGGEPPHKDTVPFTDERILISNGILSGTPDIDRNRAIRELTAILLNVVTNKLTTFTKVSPDGSSVGQLIVYATDIIYNNNANDDASAIGPLYLVNTGRMLKTGLIPAGTPDIAYRPTVDDQLPTEFSLSANYPNPFNPTTTIQFGLPTSSHITLDVFNILGQQVRRLLDAEIPAGMHSVEWDGKGNDGVTVASGTYMYRLTAGEFIQTRKMLLLR